MMKRIKRYLFGGLPLTMMMMMAATIGCTSTIEDGPDTPGTSTDDKITYSILTSNMSRATTYSSTDLPTTFFVSSYYKTDDDDNVSYFANDPVSQISADGASTWLGAGTYPWIDRTLNFIASNNTLTWVEENASGSKSFRPHFTYNCGTADDGGYTDFIYAVKSGVTKPASYAAALSNPVVFNFRHALAMAEFRLEVTKYNQYIKIRDIAVNGICQEGTYYVDNLTDTSDQWTSGSTGNDDISAEDHGYWIIDESSWAMQNYNFKRYSADGSGVTVVKDGNVHVHPDGALIVIPNDYSEKKLDPEICSDPDNDDTEYSWDKVYLRLDYIIYSTGQYDSDDTTLMYNDTDTSDDEVLFDGVQFVPINLVFEQGCKHIYTIRIGHDKNIGSEYITFDVSSYDWTDFGAANRWFVY